MKSIKQKAFVLFIEHGIRILVGILILVALGLFHRWFKPDYTFMEFLVCIIFIEVFTRDMPDFTK